LFVLRVGVGGEKLDRPIVRFRSGDGPADEHARPTGGVGRVAQVLVDGRRVARFVLAVE
jgi:hypothetical protein